MICSVPILKNLRWVLVVVHIVSLTLALALNLVVDFNGFSKEISLTVDTVPLSVSAFVILKGKGSLESVTFDQYELFSSNTRGYCRCSVVMGWFKIVLE